MASATFPSPKFQVFTSHPGEDKQTIAFPLRDKLSEKGITPYIDERHIPPGGDATEETISATAKADIAVIVLSPEFVVKKWPMKELLFFLKRREKALENGIPLPVVLPVFYRLSVADMHNEPRLDRKCADGKSLYHKTRFFERMNNGETEADVETIQKTLRVGHGLQGMENKYQASNETSSAPSRLLLLNAIVVTISRIVAKQTPSTFTSHFKRSFPPKTLRTAVLDFDKADHEGKPMTYEARVKHRILNAENESQRVIAILGVGGVGKSTILEGLANDEDFRKHFCDGVHLISLGMHATSATLLQQTCKILRNAGGLKTEERVRSHNNVEVAIDEAIAWFAGKACAFLIDDAWTKRIATSLYSRLCRLGGGEGCGTVVFTTREYEVASVAPLAGIVRVKPREMHGREALKILLCHAGVSHHDADGDHVHYKSVAEVLDICNGLPVSLAVAGKGVKKLMIDMETDNDESAWDEYLVSIHSYRDQFLREDVDEYKNLSIIFGASLDLLEKRRDERRIGFDTPVSFAEMYRRLCVLQKHTRVPSCMLRYLWELESAANARLVGMQFVEVGLAESAYEGAGSERLLYLRIHYSLHDFAVSEARRNSEYCYALRLCR